MSPCISFISIAVLFFFRKLQENKRKILMLLNKQN